MQDIVISRRLIGGNLNSVIYMLRTAPSYPHTFVSLTSRLQPRDNYKQGYGRNFTRALSISILDSLALQSGSLKDFHLLLPANNRCPSAIRRCSNKGSA